MPNDGLPTTKQKLEVANESGKAIEIMVEMIPNRYMLRPEQKLTLIADIEDAPRNEGFTVNIYDGGVQIYAAWDGDPVAYIDGRLAETDWTTPTPPTD